MKFFMRCKALKKLLRSRNYLLIKKQRKIPKGAIQKAICKTLLSVLLIYILNPSVLALTSAQIANYKGSYDYKADHTIHNPMDKDYFKIVTEEYREGVLQNCFQSFVGWGMTPQGAAGIIANIIHESGGDPMICWGYNEKTANYTWKEYIAGYDGDVGFGLIEFTAEGAVFGVWDTAAELGVQWTDLGAQLAELKKTVGPKGVGSGWNVNDLGNHPNELDSSGDNQGRRISSKVCVEYLYGKGYSAAECASVYCRTYEVPYKMAEQCRERGYTAEEVYEKYKNLAPIDSSTLVGVSDPSKTLTGYIVGLGGLVSEDKLEGMPIHSGLKDGASIPRLPNNSDLSSADKYSIGFIRDYMEMANSSEVYSKIRVALVVVGLLIVVYVIFLVLAMLFDRVNVFFDFSLVSVLTFGKLNYQPDLTKIDDDIVKGSKLIGTKRMIIVLSVMFCIGLLFIGGGVLPVIMQLVDRFIGLFT